VTISMHNASVVVLTQFLGSLSGILDQAAVDAATRKVDASILLKARLPQFFFHVTTAYDILRHCGVDLVKKDFLGVPGRLVED
jgi:hypothetical protein